jgi:hypothetical protein
MNPQILSSPDLSTVRQIVLRLFQVLSTQQHATVTTGILIQLHVIHTGILFGYVHHSVSGEDRFYNFHILSLRGCLRSFTSGRAVWSMRRMAARSMKASEVWTLPRGQKEPSEVSRGA